MSQRENTWDDAGNRTDVTRRARFENASGTGELGTPISSSQPKARVSYSASWPDEIGRARAQADYGTNGATSWTRPAAIPARSNTVLVTSFAWSAAGNLAEVTDPAGILTCRTWDDADRLVTLEENCPGSSSSSSSSSSGYATDERTTHFKYTDSAATGCRVVAAGGFCSPSGNDWFTDDYNPKKGPGDQWYESKNGQPPTSVGGPNYTPTR